ncbi:aminotransferase class I/II-fold pyridoxal phosphate-dependent enzyme [Methyloprofundus sp.]|uniref:aminotransferase class I/II-fold pyridoxal phosphate-dependent enzyme n=1 Tax=Methyloprofundus sp. TaxID=2020875 RepID=UPI003D0C105A
MQNLNTLEENQYLPDFDSVSVETWKACQLLYICSPGNPAGTILDQATHEKLIKLALQYDFVIASDECYSEIYADENQPQQNITVLPGSYLSREVDGVKLTRGESCA